MAIVLITRSDLESAGRLQGAFEPDDEVRFVTAPHDLQEVFRSDADELALIVTGAVREPPALSLIQAVRETGSHIPIVALLDPDETVPDDWGAEVGVDELFTKPVDLEEVMLVVRTLIRRKRLQAEIGIVGNSESIREVVERVAQIAPVGSTVLITGESGTGKELVARGLHKLSPRRGKNFIAVNIAALPETLLESELFGHEKGAFTGASSLRKGMFELANGGTIFLDEVAEMPATAQTRLLRVLEQREFMRVGGHEYIKVDVRVIAATNRDLRHLVQVGDFRRDLYYRLNVLHIDMPPLRGRGSDIPLLVHEFIREFSREHQREFRGIAPEAMDILMRYDWPGNVRELRNLVESMVVLAPGSVIRPADIPPDVRRGASRSLPAPVSLQRPLVRQTEREGETKPLQRPEMEMFFRTLVELKFDVEDLRREFEAYKRRHPELTGARESEPIEIDSYGAASGDEEPSDVGAEKVPEAMGHRNVIVFRPGMSMQELEKAAIQATLESVGGNRRLASEQLGIGERTLYRKLKEYEIED